MFLTKRSGIYYLNYMDINTGKYRRVSTNTKNEREAYKYLGLYISKHQVEAGTKRLTLEEFQKEYISYLKVTHSPKYISSIELSFKKLIEYIGITELHNLQHRELEKFFSLTYHRSTSAASLYFRTLKAAFNKAVLWEYLSANPIKKIKLPKLPKRLPLFISKEELTQILEKTQKSMFKEIFLFAFNTGMRLGEITHMRWNWIDIDRKILVIKHTDSFLTKGKKERIIPLNDTVQNILTTKIEERAPANLNDFVFYTKKGFRLNEDYVSKNFKKTLRKTNLNSKIHFHTLRHSFASNLVQKGASLYVVKELLGHEDIKTTQIYAHLTQKSLTEAVNLLI